MSDFVVFDEGGDRIAIEEFAEAYMQAKSEWLRKALRVVTGQRLPAKIVSGGSVPHLFSTFNTGAVTSDFSACNASLYLDAQKLRHINQTRFVTYIRQAIALPVVRKKMEEDIYENDDRDWWMRHADRSHAVVKRGYAEDCCKEYLKFKKEMMAGGIMLSPSIQILTSDIECVLAYGFMPNLAREISDLARGFLNKKVNWTRLLNPHQFADNEQFPCLSVNGKNLSATNVVKIHTLHVLNAIAADMSAMLLALGSYGEAGDVFKQRKAWYTKTVKPPKSAALPFRWNVDYTSYITPSPFS